VNAAPAERLAVVRGGAGPRPSLMMQVVVFGCLAIALAAFAAHARLYWAWTEDDAFITFRYARNLVQGHGVVFNPGERVEGYSNFSWVLLAAAALRTGHDPEQVAKIVGLASGLAAVVLSWLLARRLLVGRAGLAALIAALHLAISPVLVQHAVNGLETAFFAALLVGAVLVAAGPPAAWRRVALIALLVLLSMTRPEGALFALALLVTRAVQARHATGSLRPALVEAGAFGLAYGTYFIWRWTYFGLVFPNTYYAKVQGGTHGLIDGTQYALDYLRDSGGALFTALALVPLVLARPRAAYAPALAVAVAGFAFAVLSGGDWMFHFRFFAHVLPVLAALVAAGFDVVVSQPRPGTPRAAGVYAGMALVLLATHLGIANTELRVARTVLPALARHNYLSQNYEELGVWFRDHTSPDATIAISDVGAVGYFSERRILDMFGLIDPHIAHLRGRMHYKADPRYVLQRRPDYVVLVSLNDDGDGYSFQRIPDYAIDRQPEFHAGYELMRTVPQYWQNEFVLVYRRKT
jgi:hypothetical protein